MTIDRSLFVAIGTAENGNILPQLFVSVELAFLDPTNEDKPTGEFL